MNRTMERQIRYCTTVDGVRIAYSVEGQGTPLLMTPLIAESFILEDVSPEYRRFSRRLADSCQLIQYDPRGIGSSQGGVADSGPEALLRDVEAVVQATGLGRLAILGRAMMSLPAMSFASRHPDAVDRLVLYGAFSRMADVASAEEATGLAQMCRANWDMASRIIADMSSRAEFGDKAIQNAEWYRQSGTGEDVARLIEANVGADVTSELAHISCPTLVLQPMSDHRWTTETGHKVAAAINGASLVPLPGGLHQYALGDPEPFFNTLFDFIGVAQSAPAAAAAVPPEAGASRTILFTDIEGSTALTQRLGDAAARELLREHERVVREALKAHGGAEVKTMGDGFMASFGSAARALECAVAIQRAFAERNASYAAHPEPVEGGAPLRVRIGLNAGEPIAEDEDLFGTAVIAAARIAAQAQGGEILVSNVVRELVAGKGFMFSGRGKTALRGFDDPVEVYEVRWEVGG